MRHAYLPLLLLLALCLAPSPVRADEDTARLLLLEDEDHAEHEASLAWWEAKSYPAKAEILRRAFQSEDKRLATLAARALPHTYLSADEIERKLTLLLPRPDWVFGSGPDWSNGGRNLLGAPELATFVRSIGVQPPEGADIDDIATAHRVARLESLEALLPLLEQVEAASLRDLLFVFSNTAEYDRSDRYRAVVARGVVYGLRRLQAERAGKPRPKLADIRVRLTSTKESGLPAEVLELARGMHPDAAQGFDADKESDRENVAPTRWLSRWLPDLTPGVEDKAFLQDAVRIGLEEKRFTVYVMAVVLWAMRHLADMPGKGGLALVEEWADGEDGPSYAWPATAVMAARGDRARFDALVKQLDAGEVRKEDRPGVDYHWLFDRTTARSRAARQIMAEAPSEISDRHDLAPGEQVWRRRYYGFAAEAEDLAAVAAQLWKASDPADPKATRRLMRFHAHLHPASLDAARARALLERLPLVIEKDLEAEKYEDFDTWRRALALLEVRDRVGTVAFLEHWVTKVPDGPEFVLEMLMRLGMAGHEAAMIERWEQLEDRWLLGRVKSKPVTSFLASLRTKDPELAVDGLQGLLIQAGLPAGTRPLFDVVGREAEDDPETYAQAVADAWSLQAKGDPVGAVLRLADVAPYGVHVVGLLDDERAQAWLRKAKAAPARGHYWEATAGLARSRPADAEEILRVIRAGRTWFLESLQGDGVWLSPRVPLTEALVDGLDTNCCLGWICHVHLSELYPWLPFDDGYGGAGSEQTRRYLRGHHWVSSDIFGGLVPGLR